LNIELSEIKYRKFLKEFRNADQQGAATQAETDVVYNGNYHYYFQAPNFCLIAYNTGAGRVNLQNYNHVSPMPDQIGIQELITSLTLGGNGNNLMNNNLSVVVTLVSEAARSKVVENAMCNAIKGRKIDLSSYEILFKAYNQPAKYCGFLNYNTSAYTQWWKPLEKEHYKKFFWSQTYTGDSGICDKWIYCKLPR
jgi:hypothetical protein